MSSKFRLSALSLAVLIASATSVHAAKSNSSDTSSWYSTTSGYPMTFAGAVPTSNAWKWSPTTPVLPTSYDQFLVWAEDINGGKSNEPLFNCWNDMLCVSGLLDMDAVYFNRRGNAFGATGMLGVGVRPQFAASTTGVIGSINNANIFADLKFADFVRIHSNIAYVNGGIKEDAYAGLINADWGAVYRQGASIKADELYAVFSSATTYPLYAKIGRFYLDFGQYQPNGYGLPTIVPSLTQLMTQVRTGGAQIGFGLENGLYGSATWSMAEESLHAFNIWANRNYSARIGMMRQSENAYFNVNASYIWDVRDADYFLGTLYVLNAELVPAYVDNFYGAFSMRRQGAFAVHADGKYGQWGGIIEAAATTSSLNRDANSNLWTAGAGINYSFPTLRHDSSLGLGYQIARHARIIYGTAVMTTFPFAGTRVGPLSNQFPANRVTASYIVKIVKHVNLAVQWNHDKDFGPSSGSNLTSDFGVFRIDLEV